MRTPSLERVVERAGARTGRSPGEPCAFCAANLPEWHGHLVDTRSGRPLCVCQACSLLFDRPAASGGHYRRVPEGRRRVPGVDPAVLGVPVGLAFFVMGDDGRVRAHYPSPAGATRWEVEEERWRAACDGCPDLGALRPEIEALLVNSTAGRREAWLVPVADCYRLVGRVRLVWEGLSGGGGVRRAVDEFFAELEERSEQSTRR